MVKRCYVAEVTETSRTVLTVVFPQPPCNEAQVNVFLTRTRTTAFAGGDVKR